jgi:predicted HTH domain antitoxin
VFDGQTILANALDMTEVMMNLPEKTSLALKVPAEALGKELLLAAAVKLFELGRISSGAASELAGLPKPLFLVKLADYGVCTFDLKKEELQRELTLA